MEEETPLLSGMNHLEKNSKNLIDPCSMKNSSPQTLIYTKTNPVSAKRSGHRDHAPSPALPLQHPPTSQHHHHQPPSSGLPPDKGGMLFV